MSDWVARILAVREPEMRARLLADQMAASEADTSVEQIHTALCRAVGARDAAAETAVLTFVTALNREHLEYPTRRALYAAATQRDFHALARMLFAEARPEPPPTAVERPLKPNARPLTLGERKSLARTHDRDLLKLLARDPHPDVVSIWLGNPSITELDVVRVAAHRPGHTAVLRILAQQHKWLRAPAVRRAIVYNPATELAIGMRLVATLSGVEIQSLASEPSTHEELRLQAQHVASAAGLTWKRQRRAESEPPPEPWN